MPSISIWIISLFTAAAVPATPAPGQAAPANDSRVAIESTEAVKSAKPVQRGLLVPSQSAQLPALRPGLVKMQLRDGQAFHKGEEINYVSNFEIVTDLEMCRLQLKAAEAKENFLAEVLQTQVSLFESKIISQSDVKKAQFEHKQAEIERDNLKSKLSFLSEQSKVQSVTAPYDGTISKVVKNQGDYARDGEALCEFAATGVLHAVIYLTEEDFRGVKMGEAHQLRISGMEVTGEVVSRANQLDAATKQGKVVLAIDNGAGRHFSGQSFEWLGRKP